MPDLRISDLFQIRNRFLRSAHLERDFSDTSAMKGYVVTPHIKASLDRLVSGLAPNSGHRAWRITGDYGTGKSSFALALAHILSGHQDNLPGQLRLAVNLRQVATPRPRLLPVLVTGTREPIAAALLRALQRALDDACGYRKPRLVQRISSLADTASRTSVPDTAVVKLLEEASEYVRESDKRTGILVIVDELGKFLEFTAIHPDRQDIYFLQALAEAASRSGKAPLFVVGLLHQGFNAYADQLSQAAQREWEKVAGRFEELLFNQPLEQTASLIADALNVRVERLPGNAGRVIESEMGTAVDLGWYGADAPRKSLLDHSARVYPLHPTVLPVLVKLFGRFGQNERSLFSFLLSEEPFSLRTFCSQPAAVESFYRLHHLYDYARATFGHRLAVQSYRSHWNQIESVIESFRATDETELELLKTVGVLNLVDVPSLTASEAAIMACLGGRTQPRRDRIKEAITKLHKAKRVLYYRGEAGGYCLWPHTSVNLEHAYEDARRTLGSPQRVSSLIEKDLETRPIVARRHYIETGNLRHFEVRYTRVSELPSAIALDAARADGLILVPLCESSTERGAAMDFARSDVVKKQAMVLVAVPKPLSSLAGLVQEARYWDWVGQNVPELNHDSYAAEEVSRQIAASRQILRKRLQAFVGLRQFTEKTELQWFWQGEPLAVSSGRDLLSAVSRVCDMVYPEAPRVRNELVNRRDLSSAAAAARMRLVERLFKNASQPHLGMDPAKTPPEMSMYLSILRSGRIHGEGRDGFRVVEPAGKNDPCNLAPAFRRTMRILEEAGDHRVRVSDLFADLRRPPYGVRDGLHLLLLAVTAITHDHELAFYENDGFLRHVAGEEFLRMAKAPESFEIQLCRMAGLRNVLFERLLDILGIGEASNQRRDILDVVRPLCVFAAQLPSYTHKTQKLSTTAIAVRETLLAAREPTSLIFRDLPKACGSEAIPPERGGDSRHLQQFVTALRTSLDELRAAYPELLVRIRTAVLGAFGVPEPFAEARKVLAETAQAMLGAVHDAQMKALCTRMADVQLPESEWLESIGSLICAKPPAKWTDADSQMFFDELQRFAARFHRLESVTFLSRKRAAGGSASRVAITQPDGTEVARVVYVSHDEEAKVADIESRILATVNASGRLGVAAASRALLKALSLMKEHSNE
jgi:hypothetical protein